MATYKLLRDYTTTYLNSSNGKTQTITFKKDTTIEGKFLKSSPEKVVGGVVGIQPARPDRVLTTISGKVPPTMRIVGGEHLIEIPVENNLVEVTDNSTTTVTDDKKIGGFSTTTIVIGLVVIGAIWYFMKQK